MLEMMNRTDRFHLYYIIVNNIREEKYSGLSHVTEHLCLNQSDVPPQLYGKGYTCINHVCLYFSCDSLDTIKEIDERILSGNIITSNNLAFAKRQVIQEIHNLRWITQRNEQLIRFVTDNRIRRFPMGKIDEVERIEVKDIKEWLDAKSNNGNIYRFIFCNANDFFLYTPVNLNDNSRSKPDRIDLHGIGEDMFLQIDSPLESTAMNIYYRIPELYSKEAIIRKAFFEYCIQRKLKTFLEYDVTVQDHYFDEVERFSVIRMPLRGTSKIESTIDSVRVAIDQISKSDFDLYSRDFGHMITSILSEEKSNFDVINAMKNWILYKIPQINMEDIESLGSMEFRLFPKKQITRAPLKVVIK